MPKFFRRIPVPDWKKFSRIRTHKLIVATTCIYMKISIKYIAFSAMCFLRCKFIYTFINSKFRIRISCFPYTVKRQQL